MLVFRRLGNRILDLLRQGLTPEQIALGIAVGVTLSTFPVLGSTTLLCITASAALGLNLAAMQMVNWLSYPLQLSLFVPLLRLGSRLVGSHTQVPSLPEIGARLATNLWSTIVELWPATVGAMVIWLLASPVMVLAIYFVTIQPVRRVARSVSL
jgi:uncharacterized protein (DUF2062 family)